MAVDDLLLARARQAQAAHVHAQAAAEVAKLEFHEALRRLHLEGASLREIARSLGLSHQRVHQLVGTEVACSFCGAARPSAGKLVAGPGAWICERCVGTATRLVAGEVDARRRWASLDPPPGSAKAKWRSGERCSFCGKKPGQVTAMASAGDRRICDDCLRLCREIVAEETGCP